jgi:hypothetical protein
LALPWLSQSARNEMGKTDEHIFISFGVCYFAKIHRPIHIFVIIGKLQWKIYVQNFMRVCPLLGLDSLNIRVKHFVYGYVHR